MPTGAQLIVDLLEDDGVEVAFGLPGVHNLALWEALRGSLDPARRRPPRAGRRVRRRRLRARHRQARRRARPPRARARPTRSAPSARRGRRARRSSSIATDIPAALRRPGVYRGVLHETTDQAAMFAPVVKGAFTVAAAEDVAAGRARPRSRRATAAPPRPPTCRSRPTCSPRRGRGGRAAGSRRAAPRTARGGERGRAARRGRAAADLGRLGRARRRRRRCGRLAERTSARPCITTYGAAGILPAAPPVPRSACRRTSSPSAACGTRPTS